MVDNNETQSYLLRIFVKYIIKPMVRLSSVIAFLTTLACTTSSIASELVHLDYETTINASIESLIKGDLPNSLNTVRDLLEKYPNSRIGYKLLGDILSARANSQLFVDAWSNNWNNASQKMAGLHDEIIQRWARAREYSHAFSGQLPANLVLASPTQQYIMVVDYETARMYTFENKGINYQLVADYYITLGKEGMNKTKEGDQRTPLGVYFVNDFLPGKELPDRYGPGAFPINYPNEYDILKKRTGYGIWIHGTESENYTRVPLASDGCISLSNEDFVSINRYVDTNGNTPVIISKNIKWVGKEDISIKRKLYMGLLRKWKSSLEGLDVDTYLSLYSNEQFRSGEDNYNRWAEFKRKIFLNKQYINLDLANISIFEYPDDNETLVISFDQNYTSNNYNDVSEKIQYWQKNDSGKWRIIYEG